MDTTVPGAKAIMHVASSLVMGTGALRALAGAAARTGCSEPEGRALMDAQQEVRGRKQGCAAPATVH